MSWDFTDVFAFISSRSVRCNITMILGSLAQDAGDILCDQIILGSEMVPRSTVLLYNVF